MRGFTIEVSEGALRIMVKAMTTIKVTDERFDTDELLVLRDILAVINEDLGDEE